MVRDKGFNKKIFKSCSCCYMNDCWQLEVLIFFVLVIKRFSSYVSIISPTLLQLKYTYLYSVFGFNNGNICSNICCKIFIYCKDKYLEYMEYYLDILWRVFEGKKFETTRKKILGLIMETCWMIWHTMKSNIMDILNRLCMQCTNNIISNFSSSFWIIAYWFKV